MAEQWTSRLTAAAALVVPEFDLLRDSVAMTTRSVRQANCLGRTLDNSNHSVRSFSLLEIAEHLFPASCS